MNTTAKEVSYKILDGPSRADLFASCEYAYDKLSTIHVDFSVALGTTMPKDDPTSAYLMLNMEETRITSITHEDGSGHSFILNGTCRTNFSSFIGAELVLRRFKAYYNCRRREGCITFID